MVSEPGSADGPETCGWPQIDWFIVDVLGRAGDQQIISEEQRHEIALVFKDAHDHGEWM